MEEAGGRRVERSAQVRGAACCPRQKNSTARVPVLLIGVGSLALQAAARFEDAQQALAQDDHDAAVDCMREAAALDPQVAGRLFCRAALVSRDVALCDLVPLA